MAGALSGNGYRFYGFGMQFEEVELGPKMQACSERERRFVWFYFQNAAEGRINATDAARQAGYADNGGGSVRVKGHQLMHRDRVLAAIEEVGRKAFRGLLIPTIMAAKNVVENPKHADHANMVKSLLSRLGLGEKSGVEVNVGGEITVNHTDEALLQLRTLRELGVPREKLVEIFGFSGLPRYEKMLQIEDSRRGPAIELEAVNEKGAA